MEKIFFLLNSLFRLTGIPVHYFSPDGDMSLLSLGFDDRADPLEDKSLRQALFAPTKEGHPRLHFEADEILTCSFRDKLEHWIVLGPVSLLSLDRNRQGEYAASHHLPAESFRFRCVDLQPFSAAVSLLFCLATGTMLSETELILYSSDDKDLPEVDQGKQLQPYQLANADLGLHRLSYSDEQRIMSRITNGEVEAIKRSYSVADLSLITTSVGKLADKPLKNLEYMFCSSITLATRAAIAGGLDDELAYSTADILLQELARCKDAESMMRVQMESMYTFASYVRQAQERASNINYVERAKQYLQKHINKNFRLDDLCRAIGINKSYLCRKFKEAEGVTVLHYLQGLRVDAAKNLLRYSNQDLSSIAAYLCFPSQSRFGAVFKQFTGITPKKYREQQGHQS